MGEDEHGEALIDSVLVLLYQRHSPMASRSRGYRNLHQHHFSDPTASRVDQPFIFSLLQ